MFTRGGPPDGMQMRGRHRSQGALVPPGGRGRLALSAHTKQTKYDHRNYTHNKYSSQFSQALKELNSIKTRFDSKGNLQV